MGPPFSTILCAVELDDNSLTALGVAAKIAQREGARLVVLHVIPMDSSPTRKPNLDPSPPKRGRTGGSWKDWRATASGMFYSRCSRAPGIRTSQSFMSPTRFTRNCS